MTRDEFLEKVDSYSCCSGVHELALRAVVELHKPIYRGCDDDRCCGSTDTCRYCADEYPCDTIKVIEKELA